MDWIDDILKKCRNMLKNAALIKALILYLIAATAIVALAVVFTNTLCESWQTVIQGANEITADYRYFGEGEFSVEIKKGGGVILGRTVKLSERDSRLWGMLNMVRLFCIPVYSVVAIILVSVVYYRNKLSEPMHLLKCEMESIMRNDLSFSCRYDSADEMGDICRVMDNMRQSVVDNRKMMWELMEEQRKINAAFAHDLRTPLTVISGYVDTLLEYYPKGKISEKQLLSMLSIIDGQTVRMKDFSETMKEIHGFEAMEPKREWHTGEELEQEICSMTAGLEQKSGLSISVEVKLTDSRIYYDENFVIEVLGNLLSNAIRYGRHKIEILAQQQEKQMYLYVKDDGRGMTKEELFRADSPYYSDKTGEDNGQNPGQHPDGEERKKEQNMHFGLGLTISKILCKKHGGRISLSNSMEGGAIVCAEFSVR